MCEYLLYIKVGGEPIRSAKAYVTPCFSVDQSFWQEREGCQLHVIGKSPSLAIAFSLREVVNARLADRQGSSRAMSEEGLAELRELAVSTVRETAALYGREMMGEKPLQREWFEWVVEERSVAVSRRGVEGARTGGLGAHEDVGISSLLEGRALLWEEVETLLMKRDVSGPDLTPILHRMVLAESADWRPGVRFSVKKSWWKHQLELTCDRCGSKRKEIELTICHTCGQGCAYCTVCLGMGRSKCCTPYLLVPSRSAIAREDAESRLRASQLRWTGSYSADQAVAAEQARRYVVNDRPGATQFLIWAVCGAGKTELLFPSISEALAAGGRVLIATPRKDVVLELAPRLQRVFPQARVIAVHGSSTEKWEEADVTIATTHQVMRYYQRFPLVVLDEVDAFPYHNNPMLYRAVSRAVQPEGKLLYLSATPPRYLQKSLVAKRKDWFRFGARFSLPTLSSYTHVLLPGRYHGSALPVPRVVTVQGLHKRLKASRPIAPLLELVRTSLQSERQLFLFVPRIDDVEKVIGYLTKFFPDEASQLAGVHAADSLREEKVRAFREKRYRLMVTTTILERGVTIPRSDVVVIGAEAPVFDEASLVQIAGRVGRSVDDPAGTVLFLQADRAPSPRAAVKQIRHMNQLAQTIRSQVGQT
ncbi:DNA helicase [Brevibacillus choshinensis]|uniref:DNA helicase n=1 Tax=Brevibacillus choshinensis TaxID=54911 RepID=A0ABR5N7F6_BRECH|nr:helicase-related protein [Brevibacillus choshinensis]KQL46536.1 DNA helicase [Brevibacillus choshinensis]